ncbi:uncharacterized protein MAM_02019 [Metarhizium album ARSEF 1941]|uniref:Uncharacterized protein n=1 Tax=Metarhizium album (strain ARSEF 1941) TaxID=1081103 RepID=A0A0B2X461_METAS|nr:uncharacterized protein MAM_02019 [Metarhizium album ARSEF 1941]KHO00096.1 hypothetical protein MAM_02019 [Metarhizium album ARSEF 1941]
MNIIPTSRAPQNGGSNGHPALPGGTPTATGGPPQTSSESGAAHRSDKKVEFMAYFFERPIEKRDLSTLEGNPGNVLISWTVVNDKGNRADIDWIAWVARSAMMSNDADQVVVDKIIIDPNRPAMNSERGFLSDNSAIAPQGITLKYGEWLKKLQQGKDPEQTQEPGRRLASETDFMRFQISWTEHSTGEKGVANSGVFFVRAPPGLVVDPSWGRNVSGYDDVGTGASAGVTVGTTQSSSLPTSTSTSASDADSQATYTPGPSASGPEPGATAGIVVGSAIAREQLPFDPQYKTTAFMEDQALGAPQAAGSHPPSRSQDSRRQNHTTHHKANVGPAAVVHGGQDKRCQPPPDHAGSFTNLHGAGVFDGPSDYADGTPAPAVVADAPGTRHHGADIDSGRADPPHAHITLPIPPRIRHLVEPQHTNDDLRRLLAEEDLLDEEIARRA